MNSTQIVLKRLGDLKRLSTQLKEQTEKTSTVDFSLVKAILDTTKDVSKKNPENIDQESRVLDAQRSNNQTSPLFKFMSEIGEKNKQKSKVKQSKASLHSDAFKPLFPETSNFPKKSLSQKQHFVEDQEQELISLREQNAQLEKSLKELRDQLAQYKQNKRSWILKNQSGRDLPFFHFHEEIQAFYTKIVIHENDYKKIDYSLIEADLTVEKITISHKRGQKKQLQLSELQQILYIKQNVILLQFFGEEQNEIQSLFIRFEDHDSLHRWDLGLYINFKIISSVNGEKLFLNEIKQKKAKEEKEQQSQQIDQQHKQILKSYLDKKDQYIKAQKELKKTMLEKIEESKIRKSGIDTSRLSSENSPSKQLFQVFGKEQNEDEEQIVRKSEIIEKEVPNFFKQTQSEFIGMTKEQEQKIKQEQQKRKQEQEQQRKQRQLEEREREEQRRLEQMEKLRQQQKRKEELRRIQKEQEMMKIRQKLKIGYNLTKYAKGGISSHDKRVFISSNGLKLSWCDKGADRKDSKSINMEEIVSVNLGDIGEGIEKHVGKKDKISNADCYVVILLTSGDRKAIEFGCGNADVMREFAANLQKHIDSL